MLLVGGDELDENVHDEGDVEEDLEAAPALAQGGGREAGRGCGMAAHVVLAGQVKADAQRDGDGDVDDEKRHCERTRKPVSTIIDMGAYFRGGSHLSGPKRA